MKLFDFFTNCIRNYRISLYNRRLKKYLTHMNYKLDKCDDCQKNWAEWRILKTYKKVCNSCAGNYTTNKLRLEIEEKVKEGL